MKNIYTVFFLLIISNLLTYSASQCLFNTSTILVDTSETLKFASENINVLTKNIKKVTSFNYNNNLYKLIHLRDPQKNIVTIDKQSLPQDLFDEINKINNELNSKDEQIKIESNNTLSENLKFKTLSSNVNKLKEYLISEFDNNGLDILTENIIAYMKLHMYISAVNRGVENQTEIENIQEKYMNFILNDNNNKYWVLHKNLEGYESGVPFKCLSDELKSWKNENLADN